MGTKNKKILIIDDESELCEILDMHFEDKGYEVSTVGSTVEGLEKLMESNFDIILTDIRMPGASGFDLLGLSRMVREKTPVIIMSGHLSFDNLETVGLTKDAYTCLSKPLDMPELFEAVESAINQSIADEGDGDVIDLLDAA